MAEALRHTAILGLTTNVPFLIELLDHPAFAAGDTHTGFLSSIFPNWQPSEKPHTLAAALAASLHRSLPPLKRGGGTDLFAIAGHAHAMAPTWRLASRLLIPTSPLWSDSRTV